MVHCSESSNPEYSKILSIPSASDTFTIFLFSPFLYFSLLYWFQINLKYIIILSTALSRQINLLRHTMRLCLPFFYVSGSIFVRTQGDRAWLYFLFLYRSLWAHEEILIDFIFCFWINLCGHRRRSWLPFFSVSRLMFMGTQRDRDWISFLFLDKSSFGDALARFPPVDTRDWHVFPSSTVWVGQSVPLFSRTGQISMYYHNTKQQVMKSLSHLYCEIVLVSFSCWTSVLLLYRSLWMIGLINLVNLHVVST